jgi:hypothetical protein
MAVVVAITSGRPIEERLACRDVSLDRAPEILVAERSQLLLELGADVVAVRGSWLDDSLAADIAEPVQFNGVKSA